MSKTRKEEEVEEEPKHSWNQEKLEQEARLALLQHYSSKSTNQTILLLTVAIAFVTYAQLIMTINEIGGYLLIFGSGFAAFLVVRQMGRLIYWSAHAEAILLVKLSRLEDAKVHVEAQKKPLELPAGVQVKNDSAQYNLDLEPAYLNGLSMACGLYFLQKKKQGDSLVKFSEFAASRRWTTLAFLFTISVFVSWLLVKLLLLRIE